MTLDIVSLALPAQVLCVLMVVLTAELAFHFRGWSIGVAFMLMGLAIPLMVLSSHSWALTAGAVAFDAVFLATLNHSYDRRAIATRQSCADRLGLELTCGEKEGALESADTERLRETDWRMAGECRGLGVVVESRSFEGDAPCHVTISIDAKTKIPLGFSVRRFWRERSAPFVVGDVRFDRCFQVVGSEVEALAVLNAETRAALLRESLFCWCDRGVVLFSSDDLPTGSLQGTLERCLRLVALLGVPAEDDLASRLDVNAERDPLSAVRTRNREVWTREFGEPQRVDDSPVAQEVQPSSVFEDLGIDETLAAALSANQRTTALGLWATDCCERLMRLERGIRGNEERQFFEMLKLIRRAVCERTRGTIEALIMGQLREQAERADGETWRRMLCGSVNQLLCPDSEQMASCTLLYTSLRMVRYGGPFVDAFRMQELTWHRARLLWWVQHGVFADDPLRFYGDADTESGSELVSIEQGIAEYRIVQISPPNS